METCKRVIGGANLVCPNLPWMIFPSSDPSDYDGCCGAGETGSWTERVVPEHIIGLRVSVACYIHTFRLFELGKGALALGPPTVVHVAGDRYTQPKDMFRHRPLGPTACFARATTPVVVVRVVAREDHPWLVRAGKRGPANDALTNFHRCAFCRSRSQTEVTLLLPCVGQVAQ